MPAIDTAPLFADLATLIGDWPTVVTIGGTGVTGMITDLGRQETLQIGGDEVDLTHQLIVSCNVVTSAVTIGSVITTPDGAFRVVSWNRSPDSVHWTISLTNKD